MIFCFDTHYRKGYAKTSVVGFKNWNSSEPSIETSNYLYQFSNYESGAFYKRELPCLLSIINKIKLEPAKDILIIDGYVLLSDKGKLGLGGYLYHELQCEFPIIGVAKNDFFSLHKLKKLIYRGKSKKPLYVTSLGYDLQEASEKILSMHGEFRMPTMLKLVDKNSRK